MRQGLFEFSKFGWMLSAGLTSEQKLSKESRGAYVLKQILIPNIHLSTNNKTYTLRSPEQPENRGMFDFTTQIYTISTTSNCQTVSNTTNNKFTARVEVQTDAPKHMRFDAIVRELGRRLEPHAAAIGSVDDVETLLCV